MGDAGESTTNEIEIVLEKAAEQIPIAGVVGFEANGSFVAFAGIASDGVGCARAANTEVGEKKKNSRSGEKKAASGAFRDAEDHAE